MKGRCNCEGIEFEITGNLPAIYQCYCTLCQKQGGAFSNAATIVKSRNFTWCNGEDLISKWQKESGFSSHFCKVCGSPVPNPLGGEFYWVPMGLVGDADVEVTTHLFVDSKPSWANVCNVEQNFEAGVSGVAELVGLLERAAKPE